MSCCGLVSGVGRGGPEHHNRWGESRKAGDMIVRAAKVLLVLLIGLFSLLVGADNIVDYGTNYAFVQHVMSMDTVFPNSTLTWRAITSPALHHASYAAIIAAELLTGILCVIGAWRLWQARALP